MEFNDVVRFNNKFGLLPPPGTAGPLSKKDARRRADVMREELREFEDACADNDAVAAMDALIDLVYFAYGAAAMMGASSAAWRESWDAVHAANMAKVKTGDPGSLKFGIEKPEGWISPEGAIREALIDDGFAL